MISMGVTTAFYDPDNRPLSEYELRYLLRIAPGEQLRRHERDLDSAAQSYKGCQDEEPR
jgi:hypothetical protein